MINFRSLSLLAMVVALVGSAHAQLAATLRLTKSQYLAGEPVVGVVTITNHAGRELTFMGDSRTPWLQFVLKDRFGDPVSLKSNASFGKMTIKAGQTLAREVNLSQYYILDQPGNYSATAVVRMPGESQEGTSTGRVPFNLAPGSTYWSQKVGVPGRNDMTREYRILNFNDTKSSQIYVQVIDGRSGQNVRTFPLGDVLMIRKPVVTVDSKQRLNVMYLGTPSMWVHCQIDVDGKLVGRQIHQRAATGDPQLLTFADGSVKVANSIPFDPKAAAEAQAKVRKASDRPPGTY